MNMNNQMDNYISELKRWDTIEFEWDYYVYHFIDWEYINCENMEYFTANAFYEDLEFWDNRIFKEWILSNKQKQDV